MSAPKTDALPLGDTLVRYSYGYVPKYYTVIGVFPQAARLLRRKKELLLGVFGSFCAFNTL